VGGCGGAAGSWQRGATDGVESRAGQLSSLSAADLSSPGTPLPPSFLNLQLIHPEGRGELIMVITAARSPER